MNMSESAEVRLIRIETQLLQVVDLLQKGDSKFTRIEAEVLAMERKFTQEMSEIKQQVSFWKGGLAIVAIIWPLVIAIVSRLWVSGG